MKKVMKKIWTIAMLTMVSSMASADVVIDVNDSYPGGTVSTSQSEPADDGSVVVTLTVTPADGYEIAKPYYSGGTYYTMGVFNGQEVKSNTMWYNNTTASFSLIFGFFRISSEMHQIILMICFAR